MAKNSLLSPFVLAANLVFFLGRKVVLDVEGLADLLRRLALDHICNSLASDVKEGFDIKVVCGKDYLEQHLLVDLHELLVPLIDVGGLLARVGVVFIGLGRVVAVVFTPFDDLLQDGLVDLKEQSVRSHERTIIMTHVRNGDRVSSGFFTKILDHVLNKDGALGDFSVYNKPLAHCITSGFKCNSPTGMSTPSEL